MKKAYKQLQKDLKDEFVNHNPNRDYGVGASVGEWVRQCGIRPTATHTRIICEIYGSVPYPYQKRDRKIILKYLKRNKYKVFKHES